MKNIGTPERLIDKALSNLDKEYKQFLVCIFSKSKDSKLNFNAFKKLHELKHKIAHREPLVTSDELDMFFPQIREKAEKEIAQATQKVNQIGIKEADDLLIYIFELLTNYYLLNLS